MSCRKVGKNLRVTQIVGAVGNHDLQSRDPAPAAVATGSLGPAPVFACTSR